MNGCGRTGCVGFVITVVGGVERHVMGRGCDREGLISPDGGGSRWEIPSPCRCAGGRSQRHGEIR